MDWNPFRDTTREGIAFRLENTIDQAINNTLNASEFENETDYGNCVERWFLKIPGVSADDVIIKKRWFNRYKRLVLEIDIKHGDVCHHKVLNIDTNIFDRYSYEVKDGFLTITLYEIINEEPKFELI